MIRIESEWPLVPRHTGRLQSQPTGATVRCLGYPADLTSISLPDAKHGRQRHRDPGQDYSEYPSPPAIEVRITSNSNECVSDHCHRGRKQDTPHDGGGIQFDDFIHDENKGRQCAATPERAKL